MKRWWILQIAHFEGLLCDMLEFDSIACKPRKHPICAIVHIYLLVRVIKITTIKKSR